MSPNQDFTLYDSFVREKRPFLPIEPGKIRLYVCGMTVYDYCHIGHARVMIFFDSFVRFLRAIDYQVTYVRNITDIDDKIIRQSQAKNQSCKDITDTFIHAMQEDAQHLHTQSPDIEPKATEYVAPMIAMIETLIEKDLAYVSDSGDVCYAVKHFPSYGRLARRELSQLRAGERIEADQGKRDPLDFVLWKQAKPDEPSWPSPWGNGRPGWHIECSAMACNLLGETIDIHGGGVDLQFPHHENEIAQSEGANDSQCVRYWMHVGALQINQEKMSKSLGNFFTIREVLAKYSPETIRYFMLSTHYRHPLHYSDAQLQQAEKAYQRVQHACSHAGAALSVDYTHPDMHGFLDALRDDFHTPRALQQMAIQARKVRQYPAASPEAQVAAIALYSMGFLLGFFRENAAVQADDETEINRLVVAREQARKDRAWQQADAFRDQLRDQYQVEVEDTASGPIWRRI
jgi:cysteinyl-tRNA synthetase